MKKSKVLHNGTLYISPIGNHIIRVSIIDNRMGNDTTIIENIGWVWDYIKYSILPIIVSGIVAFLIVRWGKLKTHPILPIQFNFKLPWLCVPPDYEKRQFESINPPFIAKEQYNILSLGPPTDPLSVYSTLKYEWHFALKEENRWGKFVRLELDYKGLELDYNKSITLGKELGPWYPEKADNGHYFNRDTAFSGLEVWWVFYFKDNRKKKNHCKCRKFFFNYSKYENIKNSNWEPLRNEDQYNCDYNWGFTCKNHEDKVCENCPFKKYIEILNKKRKW